MKTQSILPQEKLKERLPALFSILWVFLSLNYILCDLLSNMEMSVIRGLFEGNIAGVSMSEGFLLFAGISLEIPILMVVLSTILPYKVNRIMNICAGILMIVYQLGSFFMGSGMTLHYLFFSSVEIIGNAAVIVLALKWKR
jgi:hypothetical protein